jgi:RNA polymerase sigma-70 factor (sigma-E family)
LGGNDRDFSDFVTGAGPALLKSARLLTGDWYLGEDLVQTTLVQVYRHWGRHTEWDSPLAYTRTAMINTFCTWRRRRWHREVATAAPVPAAGPDTADRVAASDALARALDRLDRRQRAVIVLRYFDELSVAETAAVLRCPPGTVTSIASRALEKLRRESTGWTTHELEDRR